MGEGACAGVTPIPAPVQLSVTDEDVHRMWRAVQIQRHGISRIWCLVCAALSLIVFGLEAVLSIMAHRVLNPWALASSLSLMYSSFQPLTSTAGSPRPTDVAFSEDGLTIEVAFSAPYVRHFPWSALRRIDNLGDAFMVVPKFKKPFVLPKRSFPDGGREAQAFFDAHGVQGRNLTPAFAMHLTTG